MSFYLKPPKGLTNVNNLEETAKQRIKCYENLFSPNIKDVILELECLIEDSVLDRLGHYLFRLVALRSTTFFDSFIKSEIKLLDVRLSCYSREDIKYFIKKLKKHTIECLHAVEVEGQAKQLLIVIIQVSTQLLRKDFFEHSFKDHEEVCDDCWKFHINVPFQLCPDLLASREYNISNGYLQIHSFQWKNLLLALYKTYLSLAIKEMRNLPKVYNALEDERIKDVVILIRTLFFKNNPSRSGRKQGTFKLESVSHESRRFPPCMRNLYEILQKNNRLSHNARFDFSLFLKGIGLSVNDALTFWENAYSKQHASCSRCTHSWQENEKRYIYGVRHLYGLEGSRKNYNVKSCHHIQGITLAANEEGGCPFQHFDDDNLRIALKSYLSPSSCDQIEAIISRRKESAKGACKLFFDEQSREVFQKKIIDNQIEIQDPVQYYLLSKSLVS